MNIWKPSPTVIKEDGKEVVAIFDNADDYNTAMRKVNAPAPKGAPKLATSGDGAGVGNTARDVSNGAVNKMDDIATLRGRASKNFDQHLQSCVSGGQCNGLPYNRLTTDEWEQVNQYAKERGAELVETKMWNPKTKKSERVMQFKRMGVTDDAKAKKKRLGDRIKDRVSDYLVATAESEETPIADAIDDIVDNIEELRSARKTGNILADDIHVDEIQVLDDVDEFSVHMLDTGDAFSGLDDINVDVLDDPLNMGIDPYMDNNDILEMDPGLF